MEWLHLAYPWFKRHQFTCLRLPPWLSRNPHLSWPLKKPITLKRPCSFQKNPFLSITNQIIEQWSLVNVQYNADIKSINWNKSGWSPKEKVHCWSGIELSFQLLLLVSLVSLRWCYQQKSPILLAFTLIMFMNLPLLKLAYLMDRGFL